ncbi:MAG TPA: recombination protein NinB [Rhizomicrobium sp.]|jgi:hypothetical protein|nr:recombination protein NinB [Rhizomicrobium sp.]
MSDWPLIIQAQLVNGRLKVNRNRLRKLLATRRDCELEIVIERKHATRSLAANAFYWAGVIGTISEYTGYTPEEVHEFCKARFLPKKVTLADKNGEVAEEIVIGTSTTKLNKLQFGEYIEAIRQWAAETLDLNIPNPLPLEMAS